MRSCKCTSKYDKKYKKLVHDLKLAKVLPKTLNFRHNYDLSNIKRFNNAFAKA
ncbi:hypothetical protein JCM19314_1118 [Nonlabens ulvanivorans]|uniref:Uncharacterized protein n=1 Tax=Nonlabens ulvanivorans TaxID=906888 RepID=A0A090QDU0_NONUL|nr:hypothetical protein JCM19314_1118 [Nonlabens ulvanivorans]